MTEANNIIVEIPDIGDVIDVLLYEGAPVCPSLPTGEIAKEIAIKEHDRALNLYEALKHVSLSVQLIDRDKYVMWARKHDALFAGERTKLADDPDRKSIEDDEFRDKFMDLNKVLIRKALKRVRGIKHGGVDLATVEDPKELAERIYRTSLLLDFTDAVKRAQTPTPRQRDCLPRVG